MPRRCRRRRRKLTPEAFHAAAHGAVGPPVDDEEVERVVDAARGARHNVVHLHVERGSGLGFWEGKARQGGHGQAGRRRRNKYGSASGRAGQGLCRGAHRRVLRKHARRR